MSGEIEPMNGYTNGHVAIIGMTGSGKTTLGYAMAEEFLRRGRVVLVLDPIGNPWPCSWKTNSLDTFLIEAKNRPGAILMVDEAGDFGKLPEFAWIFTQSRNTGHRAFFISQRHTQVPPLIRENCETLFMFKVSQKSADMWSEEFANPEISNTIESLARYHFIGANRYQIGPIEATTLNLGKKLGSPSLPAPTDPKPIQAA